jgi:hypothetical protein
MSHLHLLVGVYRMLTKEDQNQYEEAFAAYTRGDAGQYVYHIKGQDTGEHLQKIGELIERMLVELQPAYNQEPVYRVLERVFGEHFRLEEEVLKIKMNKPVVCNRRTI